LEDVYNDDSHERIFEHCIYAYDNNPKAIEVAERNFKAAGVCKVVKWKVQPFQQFEQPEEKSIIITNPPYGERISSEDLLGLYQMIGERFKHAFMGNDAWVLSYKEECFDSIGLKPSDRISLFNGALACEFRRYQIFGGKYNDYRTDHHEEKFKTNRGSFRPHHLGEKRTDIQRKGREDSEERKPYARREQSERNPRGERKAGERSGERRGTGERKGGGRFTKGEKRNGDRKPGRKPAFAEKKDKSPRNNKIQ
jgi:putative N6-adenine-specific DNA methylase